MYSENAKTARESKSSNFLEALSQLYKVVNGLEELCERIVGRTNDAVNQQVSVPEPPPYPALIINVYPEKLQELRDRIQKVKDEISESLF